MSVPLVQKDKEGLCLLKFEVCPHATLNIISHKMTSITTRADCNAGYRKEESKCLSRYNGGLTL